MRPNKIIIDEEERTYTPVLKNHGMYKFEIKDDMPIVWEAYMKDDAHGYYLSNGSKNIQAASGANQVLRRSIIFPCQPNKTVTVLKNVSTTMRIGFVSDSSDTKLINNALQLGNTRSIQSVSPNDTSYCVCQLAINSEIKLEGTLSTGSYTWDDLIDGLDIKII